MRAVRSKGGTDVAFEGVDVAVHPERAAASGSLSPASR
jgi:hypothetical protein